MTHVNPGTFWPNDSHSSGPAVNPRAALAVRWQSGPGQSRILASQSLGIDKLSDKICDKAKLWAIFSFNVAILDVLSDDVRIRESCRTKVLLQCPETSFGFF